MNNDEILKKLQERNAHYTPEMQSYKKYMTDILYRTNFIHQYFTTKTMPFDEYYMNELICLQFRSISELIMLSSWVANQKEYRRLIVKIKKIHTPNMIKSILESINEKYYPAPQILHTIGDIQFEPMKQGFLTIDDVLKIYYQCSKVIHPKHPFLHEEEVIITIEKFKEWYIKIKNLLAYHHIYLKGEEEALSVIVNFDKRQVICYYMMKGNSSNVG